MGALAELEEFVSGLNAEEKSQLDIMLEKERHALWLPEPENKPQIAAYVSQADLLLFGGAAGGGKSSLLCGLALTEQTRSVIFRAQATDLRGLEEMLVEIGGRDGWNGQRYTYRKKDHFVELGHLGRPGSELSWMGRPHDFIGFDEGAQLARAKVQFVCGWLRSTKKGQRKRIVIASNPPTGGEGLWLLEWFAPWLDDKFPNKATPGELRWAVTAHDKEGTTIWLPDNRPIVLMKDQEWRLATEEEIASKSENVIEPLSRTFIPSLLSDNPHLAQTGYRARLQALPEPLRSQLLNGSFLAGQEDHLWQVIPTAWVKAAMDRWTPDAPNNAMMSAIAADVAQGGADASTIARRHGPWFAPIIKRPGIETPKPSDVAGMIVTNRRNNAVVIVDMGGGYGGGVKERLEDNGIDVHGYNGANESSERTKDKSLTFYNKRAESMWRFREALDPDQDGGSPIALPNDPELLGDLTAPRWKLLARGIQVESKEDLREPERLGRSPDKGDAVIMAWSEGEKALVAAQRKRDRNKPVVRAPSTGQTDGTGWLGG